jgi:hypothetical protein
MLGFRQRSLNSPTRRLRNWIVIRFTNRARRTQRVYLVTINDQRFKRLVLCDSHQADTYAANLRAFANTGLFPAVILAKENELWVEFIEGEKIDRLDSEVVEKLARLFSVLYRREARRVASESTSYNHDLHTDLRFLHQVGVLTQSAYRRLDSLTDSITPAELWVGYDCSDAILKNFLICDDGLVRCIDVDSLAANQMIGTGVAKACLRWLGPQRDRFLDELQRQEVPDFLAYLPFVELSFTAFWVKNSFLEKKKRFVDPAHFDRFVD